MKSSFISRLIFVVGGLTLVGCNEGNIVPNPNVPTPTATPSTTPATPTPTPTPVTFVEENFHQGYSNSKVDVLWVVDDSGSMGQEQTALANSFAAFITGFIDLDLDFHLGVITTDMTVDPTIEAGRLRKGPPPASGDYTGGTGPAFLDAQTPNVVTEFQARANVGIDSQTFDERGLAAAQAALSPPLINMGQHNYGFLRDEAVLSVLFVSDEEEGSSQSWQDYVYFFSGLKADPSKIQVSSIVGPAGGCSGQFGSASDGSKYRLVASSFNGVNANICTDDFSSALQLIADAAAALSTGFALDHFPIPGTIQVYVDGVLMPGGASTWSYNPTSNEIVFASGAIPSECGDIRVRYALAPGQYVTEPVVNHPDDPSCP